MSALALLQLDAPLSHLLAFAMPLLDALIPVVPSETAAIALGVTNAERADPHIAVLVGPAALGAFVGDNLSYLIGRRFGPAVDRRLFSTPKGAHRPWIGLLLALGVSLLVEAGRRARRWPKALRWRRAP